MCDKFQCYPDIWALHEWSNWLTPTTFGNKRFNTAFFMTFMESQPDAHFDPTEMEDLRVCYFCQSIVNDNFHLEHFLNDLFSYDLTDKKKFNI